MFQQPSAASDFKAADHVGHLLVIYVRDLREGIVTQYGTSEAIACDVVVLTDPTGPRLEAGVLLFQKPLIGSLRQRIGQDPVLARLGQGTAKPGQSAPYILNPYSEQDLAYATQWMTSVGGNPFQTAPALQQPAPVAPLPQAVPQAPAAAFPVPAGVGAGVPAPVAAPMTQAPGVPAAPPAWAVPAPQAVAPVAAAPQYAPQPAPAPNAVDAAAAMQALGMTQMPPVAPQ